MERTIDVHNHFYPKEWLDYLQTRKKGPRMEQKGPELAVLYLNDTAIATIRRPGHFDPKERLKDLDRCGIDTQVLSLTTPSIELLPPEEGVKWAKRANDIFADVCQKYPGRYYATAALPCQDVGEAVKELDRAYKDLKVKGIMMFSNVNGKSIASPEFDPIYARAEKYDLPIFIHPGMPVTLEAMKSAGPTAVGVYGFTLDTTLAVMSLIWQGILERYPRLTIIHAHLGGVVPYLVWRMEEMWRLSHITQESEVKLKKTPSEYYKSQVYPDSVSFHLPAMRCCLEFVGPRHICLGTDYAHRMGNWDEAVDYVKKMSLSKEDTELILGGNAARIFKIE
jgi:aminocarboxymuconate-semialdehyde decarboxylase